MELRVGKRNIPTPVSLRHLTIFGFPVQMDRSRVRASCLCHGDYTALVWKKNHKFGVKQTSVWIQVLNSANSIIFDNSIIFFLRKTSQLF